jgi:hypothetical protein
MMAVGRGVSLDVVGGERRILLSSPQSRRSLTSFFRFLVFFTEGGVVSGDCTGVVGVLVAALLEQAGGQ